MPNPPGLPPLAPEFGRGLLQKFGFNPSISSGTVPEDIWEGGGLYQWPAAAAVVTLVSDDPEDDPVKTGPGTGAHSVEIQGTDANYNFQVEIVTLNGTSQVSSQNTFLRVFRMRAVDVGSYGANVGTITAQISGSTVALILPDNGQTLMAIYTVPADFRVAHVVSWFSGYGSVDSSAASMRLFTRIADQSWRVKLLGAVSGGGQPVLQPVLEGALELPPATDMRVTCIGTDGTAVPLFAGFELKMLK
jgi:hypothetical protein